MSFLEELQSVVGMIASDEKEDEKPQSEMLKPMSQSSGVQDLTTQWKKREVAAESADRLMPMQLSGRIQPLNAILQAEGEDGKTLTLVNEISDADSALLQNASGQTITHEPPMKYEVVRQSLPDSPALPQPRELPAEREVALVVPAETRVKLPVREIPIDLKTGDKPFSKWKEPTPSGEQLKGKLQLVNAEEEMPIEALKVSKITKMIGGGTEVMNAPKPEMVEAQLPVAVPVYANAPTQQVREGDKLIKTLMLTPAPSIVPIKTVAPNNDPAPSLMPPALPEDEVAYQPRLSSETKSLLSSLPANAGKPKYDHNGMPLDMAHSGGASSGLGKKTPDIHKAQGVRIDVKNPDLDVNQYLEQAYEAQLKEDLGTAMDRYQAIVEAYPDNNEAKFGLATTYHRMGELLMARNLYAEIIQSEPGNLEALNNLLVLVSQESPEEALAELQKLEKRNPYFSPIPAQMAALYAKNRDFGSAVESIQRAMDIDPRNLAYRYNAAVLMDRAGRRQDAIDLYTSLKRSHERGLDVPADMAAIQERLTFLLSNRG
jgi:Tfp pilus assembly protein PilF